jgi:hypothetical protein
MMRARDGASFPNLTTNRKNAITQWDDRPVTASGADETESRVGAPTGYTTARVVQNQDPMTRADTLGILPESWHFAS